MESIKTFLLTMLVVFGGFIVGGLWAKSKMDLKVKLIKADLIELNNSCNNFKRECEMLLERSVIIIETYDERLKKCQYLDRIAPYGFKSKDN